MAIDTDVNENFRGAVGKKFGANKGAVQKGVEEAFRDFTRKVNLKEND